MSASEGKQIGFSLHFVVRSRIFREEGGKPMDIKAKLVERSEGEPREYPLAQQEFLIGRGADCDLRLRSSSISRHHCLIRSENDGLTLVDLGSSNGTFLNGTRVRSQAELKTGDEIRLDKYAFVIDLGDQPELGRDPAHDSVATTVRLDHPFPKGSGIRGQGPEGQDQ
jgi:pSer/pThr/pTyr-binding forkhead associated (FHA) protein